MLAFYSGNKRSGHDTVLMVYCRVWSTMHRNMRDTIDNRIRIPERRLHTVQDYCAELNPVEVDGSIRRAFDARVDMRVQKAIPLRSGSFLA